VICEKCEKPWDLLLAHLIQEQETDFTVKRTVQCPACGHLQIKVDVRLLPSGGT
jgi:DNA-directed RNA polymerase subunit RPC12/RpoP